MLQGEEASAKPAEKAEKADAFHVPGRLNRQLCHKLPGQSDPEAAQLIPGLYRRLNAAAQLQLIFCVWPLPSTSA